MNCDDAFDHMTDPVRCHSGELDWHLKMCPRCRQMREVLAPALDLLAPADSSRDGEPEYFPSESAETSRAAFLSPESLAVAERAAAELSRQRRVPATRRQPGNGLMRYAAALMVGAALALGGSFWFKNLNAANPPAFPAANSCLLMQRPVSMDSLKEAGADNVIRQCQVCHRDSPR